MTIAPKAGQKPQAPVAVAQKKNKAIIDDPLALICEELSVKPSELQDDTVFAEIGLNSLMLLTITGCVHEEVGLEAIPGFLYHWPCESSDPKAYEHFF